VTRREGIQPVKKYVPLICRCSVLEREERRNKTGGELENPG